MGTRRSTLSRLREKGRKLKADLKKLDAEIELEVVKSRVKRLNTKPPRRKR